MTAVEKERPIKSTRLPLPVQANTRSNSKSSRQSERQSSRSKWRLAWSNFLQNFGPGTAPSSIGTSPQHLRGSSKSQDNHHGSPGSVIEEEVVVDRIWDDEIDYDTETSSIDEELAPDPSGASPPKKSLWREADPGVVHSGCTGWLNRVWFFFRWQLLVAASEFFYPRAYSSEEAERSYLKEDWFVKKPLARWAALWLIFNWVLGMAFFPHPFQKIDIIFYGGVSPALSFPIIFMVLYNWPRDHAFVYQVYLTASVWAWSIYQILFIYLCGLYNSSHSYFSCNERDFIGIMFYTTALQAIALFGLKLDRFPAAIGAAIVFVMSCALVVPDNVRWTRSMLNFAFYHAFLIYVHYMRENAERRLHNLRLQVKMQYRATQRAQVNERKMSDSKYRLTSYVFHEVRVPLNAAVLAVQNMGASGTIVKEMEIEFEALKGSLETMSKVLNDVLDFNRIDSGNFESVSQPFQFHQTFTTLYKSFTIPATHKGLTLTMDLDPIIDEAARRASYKALGLDTNAINRHLTEHPDVPGVVIGDEARVRQIVSNLATNAIKFTDCGGSVRITTQLVSGLRKDKPSALGKDQNESDPVISVPVPSKHNQALSESNLSLHNHEQLKTAPSVIVRIVVTDTGCGIAHSESRKLFSPFTQTERGRAQGGTGTGLGLSLVRSIVKLLGGRLGFSSHKGVGSTFWVELPLGVGGEALLPPHPPGSESDGSSSNDMKKVRAAARQMTTLPASATKDSMLNAVDAAALDASASWTSIPAHSNILHQVVPLSPPPPSRQSSDIKLPSSPPVSATKNSFSPPTSLPPTAPASPTFPDSSTATTGYKKPYGRRPTSVSIPSTLSFAPDPQPTTSTDISVGSNKMTLFDRAFSANNATSSDISEETPTGLSVLVVDDDLITRSMMDRMLKRLGCEVTLAENGKAAIQLIMGPEVNTPGSEHSTSNGVKISGPILAQNSDRSSVSSDIQRKFNVTFMDNQMPIMSGLQAIKFLRSQGRKDFVVGLTGNALLPDQNEYIEAGVDIVLTKPVLERQLKDVLRQADVRRKRNSRRYAQDHPP